MDQDETWHGGRPRPWPHCIRWGPSSPPPKEHSPFQFSAHIFRDQMAGWIKMPLGMEVGLGPGHTVLDGDTAPLFKKGHTPPIFGPCILWPNGWMDQDGTWHGGRPRPRPHCARWGPSSSPKWYSLLQFLADVCCDQTAGWIKLPLGTKVWASVQATLC